MTETPLDIPYKAPHVEATLAQTHVRAVITPTNHPLLTYDLLVPKGWAFSSEFGPVTQMLLVPEGLGFFAGGADPHAPVIAVTATPCPFEVPPDAWIREALRAEGWTTVKERWFPGSNGMFFDITGTRTVDDVELVRRTSIRVDFGRLLAVNTMCGRPYWDAVKESFWAAHATFALESPQNNPCLENWLRTSVPQPDFQVSHPSSWVPERAEPNADSSGLHLRLTDPDETVLLGYLLVHCERKLAEPVLAKLAATTAAKIERSGVTLLGSAHPVTFEQDPRAEAVEGWLAGYRQDGKLGDAEIEVRFDFVERPHLIFTLLGFGPKRTDDVLTSLRVQRAYEIARATLKALES